MNPHVVVDVGNSRMKWGLCTASGVTQLAVLPLDAPQAWADQQAAWQQAPPTDWFAAAVNPKPLERLVQQLRHQGHRVQVLESYRQIPLVIEVEQPDRVGVDRLLNAVAAKAWLPSNQAAVLVDAGSAVTVDWLSSAGAFCGGAIFPGLRLMAQALHAYTARLPLVTVVEAAPTLPGRATVPALVAGIHAAVVGGILYLVERYRTAGDVAKVYLTGGDGPLLQPALEGSLHEMGLALEPWPLMTLEGLRQVALHQPA